MTPRISEALRKLGKGAAIRDIQDFFPQILNGGDPLGDYFVDAVSPSDRRVFGATLTPNWLIDLQLEQIGNKCSPARVIDAGAGTGRYALRAARLWPRATVVAVEKEPALANAIRINAVATGLTIDVWCEDYLSLNIPELEGTTAFIGNPPYIRHHDISAEDKAWYSREMSRLSLPHSQLAGLHMYFYLKSYLLSRPGDVGSFVSAAEWLDTNYGKGMRELFCRMGGDKLIRVDPSERVFPDALTTSVIGVWAIGNERDVEFADLEARIVQPRTKIARDELLQREKWPGFGRVFPKESQTRSVLGAYFRISRGQVTGCNHLWIATDETAQLIPERYLFPCITDANEIIHANGVLRDGTKLRRVIDLPSDLRDLTAAERKKVDEFLETAKHSGASDSYIARHRKPWWRVALKPAPPIVMSYMGRRPPVFARNACEARVLNIAHMVVPVRPMSIRSQDKLVAWLNENVCTTLGRTYGGGLVKFEPGEAMRIPIPAGLVDVA
jgi:adenine-specific DNA-methyltransferase